MIKHSKNVHELAIDKPYAQIAMLSQICTGITLTVIEIYTKEAP
jgi:hypothetical protein